MFELRCDDSIICVFDLVYIKNEIVNINIKQIIELNRLNKFILTIGLKQFILDRFGTEEDRFNHMLLFGQTTHSILTYIKYTQLRDGLDDFYVTVRN